MRRLFLCVVDVCLLASTDYAQTPDTVITGPYGKPRLVKNEGGSWSVPIQVFSDTEEIVYVPDITTPGWAQWHSRDFKDNGEYFTYVYTYLRKQRATVQETLYVDIQKQQVLAVPFLKTPIRYDLRNGPPKIVRITNAITRLVQDSVHNFQGPDIQSAARQQRYATGRLFLCNDPQVAPSPDCNLSDEEFQKKQSASQLGTSTPVLLHSVEPQYPPEARTEKLGGTVTVGMTVDKQGTPRNLHIVQSRGAALDQAALAAVNQYRFSPAHDATGTPIEASVNVNVDFQIF